MQVKVNIHESLIKKIKPGQKAEIRVDAFPNVVFVGKVKTVSQLADSNRPLDERRGQGIHHDRHHREDAQGRSSSPGMTAEVQDPGRRAARTSWSCRSRPSPSTRGSSTRSSTTPGGVERRKVKIGETNETDVEILDGLKEGETRRPRRPHPRRRRVQDRGGKDEPTSREPSGTIREAEVDRIGAVGQWLRCPTASDRGAAPCIKSGTPSPWRSAT